MSKNLIIGNTVDNIYQFHQKLNPKDGDDNYEFDLAVRTEIKKMLKKLKKLKKKRIHFEE